MIIVSGKLFVRPGTRADFLKASAQDMATARLAPGCRDFTVAADPIDPDRINVYEEWESEEELLGFRGAGPSEELLRSIVGAEVQRHVVSSSGPA